MSFEHQGVVAQMVERSLSMREVRGSIPRDSTTTVTGGAACPAGVGGLVVE